MKARASLDPNILVDFVRTNLDKLGFSYRTTAAEFIVEFEVLSPCHMLVRVEDLTVQRRAFSFLGPSKPESAIEMRRVVGTEGSEEELRRCASAFLQGLLKSLPREPWRGTGFLKGRSGRNDWERLDEL